MMSQETGSEAGSEADPSPRTEGGTVMVAEATALGPAETGSPPPLKVRKTSEGSTPNPQRKESKAYKGLRHFSLMVCKKVEEKGTTTYNEVADELVRQILSDEQQKFDEKNIRRRVYDALNVLMAMNIIIKDKKEISWKGLPSQSSGDPYERLQQDIQRRTVELQRKRDLLREMLLQHVCFRNLVQRNFERAKADENDKSSHYQKIPLPFIVVNTSSAAVIQCNMSRDLTDVMFDFTLPFEINDDNSILKRLKLYVPRSLVPLCLPGSDISYSCPFSLVRHRTTHEVLSVMLPKDIYQYCWQHHLLDAIVGEGDSPPLVPSASS
jgi:Transcription factor DP/E2F/DP family winged-helix DNA-binding domain